MPASRIAGQLTRVRGCRRRFRCRRSVSMLKHPVRDVIEVEEATLLSL